MDADAVDRYLASAPEDQKTVLEHLRALIRLHLPEAEEQIGSSGFPVYSVKKAWVGGFATRKKCPMLYVMARGVLDEFEASLGPLRSGRSCVEWRPSKGRSDSELRELAGQVLARTAETLTPPRGCKASLGTAQRYADPVEQSVGRLPAARTSSVRPSAKKKTRTGRPMRVVAYRLSVAGSAVRLTRRGPCTTCRPRGQS